MCCYFDDIIKFEDFDFNNILLDKKSYASILTYDVLYKTLAGAKPLQIMFDNINGFIRDYDGTKCLALFCLEKYVAIYNRIRYRTELKSSITYFFFLQLCEYQS